MKKVTAGILSVALALFATQSLMAQGTQPARTELTAKEVIAKLEEAGYRSITDIEKDDGVWEVDAVNAAGERVEVDVDPVTGKILRERPDYD